MDIVREITKEFVIPSMAKVYHLEEKVSVLKSNMEDLSIQKHDLEMKLSSAERLGQQIKMEVQVWLEKVREISNEVGNIINALGHSSRCSRVDLGNRVEKALKQVATLQDKCKNFDELVMPNVIMPMPTTKIVGEATGKTIKKIWKCLMDPEVGSIGIYGMGGVGKTFIMKHIYNHLIDTKPFGDHVFWITMSEAMNLQMVQGKIAKEIDVELSNDEDVLKRSRRILVALMSMKKFILILDEVWEAFPLDEIGIPELKDGRKLLFTTRDLGVCSILQFDKQIKVDVPSEDAAWELLKNKIGGDTVLSSNVQDIARQVANECGRLPLAIVTVGQALWKKSDASLWRNTLNKLRFMKKIKYMEEHILPRLRSSYYRLRNKEYQDHFLYCALYPQQHHIPNREIIEHWVWDGLIEEVDNKQDAIDEGDTILKELKDACLLESCESNVECVTMHNLIRHMAIDITRTTQQFMVKAGVELEESPSEEEWTEDLVRISLMKSNIEVLPREHKCSKLSTLLLQNNNSLRRIMSPSFFLNLHCLRILNLSHTAIESLPESISALVNLHALLLGSCSSLKKLPPLRSLKKLRVLDISSTAIVELPQGLEELVKLRTLDLSWTCNLGVIQTCLMSNLSNLEDLEMYGSGWRWSSNSEEMRRVIEEVTNLRRLRNLSLHFANLVSLTNYVNSQKWRRLKTFSLVVGPAFELCPRLLGYSVAMASCDLIDQENSHVIPDNTELLRIEECHLTLLSQLHCSSNLKELKECEIYKCRGMDCVVRIEENELPSIEKLDLRELPCSRVFSNIGVIPHGALANLRFLYIDACHHLNILFSLGLLQQLTKLEEVKVQDCRLMKEMVAKEGWNVEADITSRNTRRRMTITFPSLKLLTLVDLPELESIGGESISCISLTCLVIKNCPNMKKLPFNDLSFNLEGEIRGSRVWWDALDWDLFNFTSRRILQSVFIEETA